MTPTITDSPTHWSTPTFCQIDASPAQAGYRPRMSESPDRPIFKLRRLPEKTDEALLNELRRVAALIPEQAVTVAVFKEHGNVERKIYSKRFGGWFEALKAAGLEHRTSNVILTRGAHPTREMSDEDVLAQLRGLADRLGVEQLTTAMINEHLPISAATLRKRWGTSQAAFKAAGLDRSRLWRRYSAEDCHTNMLAVWTHYGRPPKHSEMALPPSEVGGKAYMTRFGTWNKALAAFVERMNAELAPTPAPMETSGETRSAGERPAQRPVRTDEDVRNIPLGLRFRVLHRDRFKCILCGDHPARNPECRLHVDHLMPWSKGGKTHEDNLRTLCADCNLGRGNRFWD